MNFTNYIYIFLLELVTQFSHLQVQPKYKKKTAIQNFDILNNYSKIHSYSYQ